MRDAIEHPSDREEPGGEERGCPCRPKPRNGGDPNREPRQVEDEKERERHTGQPEPRAQSLMKTGRRLLSEVDALNYKCNGECPRGGETLCHVLSRRPTTQRKHQCGECSQTQNHNACEHTQHEP